jgi:hypothetical protein
MNDMKYATVSNVKKQLLEMDPKSDVKSKEFKASMILLYGSLSKTFTVAGLCAKLGYSVKFVKPIVHNIKKNKIWQNGYVRHSGWDDKEYGGLNFTLDVTMALGYIERA